MASEIKIVDGEIIFKSKKYNRMIEGTVINNNKSSGKIQLPIELIGKKICVVWREK